MNATSRHWKDPVYDSDADEARPVSRVVKIPDDEPPQGLPKRDSQRFRIDLARAELIAELERMRAISQQASALDERATTLLARCAKK
jgi:hypothetical protein